MVGRRVDELRASQPIPRLSRAAAPPGYTDSVVRPGRATRLRACVEVGDGLRRGPATVWPHATNTRIQPRHSGARGAHPDDTWTSPRLAPAPTSTQTLGGDP
jgi:hypothetical protein